MNSKFHGRAHNDNNGEDNDDVDDETTKSAQSPAITINDNGNSENQLFIGAAASASGSADVKSQAHTHTTTGTRVTYGRDSAPKSFNKYGERVWYRAHARNVHTWSFIGVLTFARIQVEGASAVFFPPSPVALLLSMRVSSSSHVITRIWISEA